MKKKIEIVDNFLSHEECDYLINFYEKNKDIQRLYQMSNGVPIMEIEITIIKEFDSLREKLNKHVYSQGCKVDWINIVKWGNGCSKNLHQDLASTETVYSSISYLNQGYIGGKTYFEDGTSVAPVKGRSLFFDGVYYKHGVLAVQNPPRYVVACWFKKI